MEDSEIECSETEKENEVGSCEKYEEGSILNEVFGYQQDSHIQECSDQYYMQDLPEYHSSRLRAILVGFLVLVDQQAIHKAQ